VTANHHLPARGVVRRSQGGLPPYGVYKIARSEARLRSSPSRSPRLPSTGTPAITRTIPGMSLDSSSERRRGILLYGMYDLKGLDRAPEVRIAMMTGALSHRVHTERVVGGRLGRTVAAFRWLASGGPRRVGAVYVEASTSAALPGDIAFLALMRLLGRPVGVYFRDAYQLFRDLHPRQHRRQLIVDGVWRLTTRLLKRIATVRYAPSSGLARVLGFGTR